MISFGHPLVVTVIVFTIVLIVAFCIYRLKSRSTTTHGENSSKEEINHQKQKLPLAYINIDLLRDTKVMCLEEKENVKYLVQYTLNMNQLHMIARFIKNDYIYCFSQVYREGDMLYLYGREQYHMLVPKGLVYENYIEPKLIKHGGGIAGGAEDRTKVSPADENDFTRTFANRYHQFEYNGKKYICNFAYPSFDDYVGLCENVTSIDYYYNAHRTHINNNKFYKVKKFNGDMMYIEEIIDQSIIQLLRSNEKDKSYHVFGIYEELNRLFMFDPDNKRYMPIIWSNQELGETVVNLLDLHKPYFFCNDTSLTEFKNLEDILCIDNNHWVVQDDSEKRSYDGSTDGRVEFDHQTNKLMCKKSNKEIIFASPGYFDNYQSNIRKPSDINNVMDRVKLLPKTQHPSGVEYYEFDTGMRGPPKQETNHTHQNTGQIQNTKRIREKLLYPHEKPSPTGNAQSNQTFPANTWFEVVTGMKEEDWTEKITDETFRQEHFKVHDNNMISIINSKTKKEWNAGELFYESIGKLSSFKPNDMELPLPIFLPTIKLLSGSGADIKRIMAQDIRDLENGTHMFQAASQFDGLESYTDTQPTSRSTFFREYINDGTQGPFVSLMAPAAAITRRDYVLGKSQIPNNLVNYLDELSSYFTVENGYIVGNDKSKSLTDNYDELLQKVKVMYNKNASVYFDIRNGQPLNVDTGGTFSILDKPIQVHQVFTAAMNIGQGKSGYLNRTKDTKDNLLVKLKFLLEAAYTSTYLAAHKCGARFLWLTLVGGGVFGNFIDLIVEAINKVHLKYGKDLLGVYLCDYDGFVQKKQDGSLTHNKEKMKKKRKVTSTE
jgi:hypothetical protein